MFAIRRSLKKYKNQFPMIKLKKASRKGFSM